MPLLYIVTYKLKDALPACYVFIVIYA